MSTELDEIIGAIVTAIARARRLADQETASIAEHYRQHPLLSGMSVPRVRLPEVTVDLPLVVDDYQPGSEPKVATPAAVNQAAREALKAAFEERGQRLPTGLLSAFRDRFNDEARRLPESTDLRTAYGDLADRLLVEAVGPRPPTARIDADLLRIARQRVREAVELTTIEQPALPSRLGVTVLTSAVKEVPDDRVTRVRLHLREEGVEWTTIPNEDGSESHRLVPE